MSEVNGENGVMSRADTEATPTGAALRTKSEWKQVREDRKQAGRSKRDAKQAILFANYRNGAEAREDMAAALLEELVPAVLTKFLFEAAKGRSSAAVDTLHFEAESHAQHLVVTVINKMDKGDFVDAHNPEHDKGITAFQAFRSYIATCRKNVWRAAEPILKEMNNNVPLVIGTEERSGNGALDDGDSEAWDEENPIIYQEYTNRLERLGYDAFGHKSDIRQHIFTHLKPATDELFNAYKASGFKANKTAELLGWSLSRTETALSRMKSRIRLAYLELDMQQRFGLDDYAYVKTIAKDILPLIEIFTQLKSAAYPKTWAGALELELQPKQRIIEIDKAKSSRDEAVRRLYRLWTAEHIGRLTISIQACAESCDTGNKLARLVEDHDTALTVAKLAQILQVSTRQIYELVQDGRLPAIKVGTLIRLDPGTTATWIRSRMTVAA
jgi:excisionase family DNA binding protein